MDTSRLERRTFKDYLRAYGMYAFSEKFFDFTSWVRFLGYVPTHFGNECFMFNDGKLTNLSFLREQMFNPTAIAKDLEENQEKSAQILDFINEIDADEDRWGIEDDAAKSFQFKKPIIEKFIRVLFPYSSFRCPLIKTDKETVLKSFERVLGQNIMKFDGYDALLPFFMADLDAFLSSFLDNNPNQEIWLIENSCSYWQDIGFVTSQRNYNDFYMYLITDDN
jgi:hypothetical protein